MAHFAELDENNNVLRVIVVSNDDCLDQNGNENEVIGALFCHKLLGGKWIQTSYNGNIRGKYAAVGDLYDEESDTFISPTYTKEQDEESTSPSRRSILSRLVGN